MSPRTIQHKGRQTMKTHFTFPGTYGAHRTPCQVHAVQIPGGFWYACDGSRNVNLTPVDLRTLPIRINVETLPDADFFTSREPITGPEDIAAQLEE